jgi:hypothetical protein
VNGACAVRSCTDPRADCNDSTADGGTASCPNGACGVVCEDDEVNSNGTCVIGPSPKRVAVGYGATCAIQTDGTLKCWGDDSGWGMLKPPSGTFRQIDTYDYEACGVKTDDSIVCWGRTTQADTPTPPAGKYRQVSVGFMYACGLTTAGKVACAGIAPQVLAVGPFREIAATQGFVCAIRTDDSLVCWGNDENGVVTNAPTGSFRHVSANRIHACAVRLDGSVSCWGNTDLKSVPGKFRKLDRDCGLETDGTITCWRDVDTTTEHTTGSFLEVTGQGAYAKCAIKSDKTLGCWGSSEALQNAAPAGTFW